MAKKQDGTYKVDKGKVWRFTSVCETWASYKGKTGELYLDEYVPCAWIDDGLVEEVNDPDFVVMPGFRAVYDTVCGDGKIHTFDTGNPVIYPYREMAKASVAEFNSRPWNRGGEAYVVDATYEGRRPKANSTFEGKTVYNRDTFMYAYPVGVLVESEVVEDAMDMLPPACMRFDCSQVGGPVTYRVDENGKVRATYSTFKRITKEIWEYCGDCFRGENVQRGEEINYV